LDDAPAAGKPVPTGLRFILRSELMPTFPRTRHPVRAALAWTAALGLGLGLGAAAQAQRVSVSPAPDGKAVVIEVEPSRLSGPSLLEVVDGSGTVLKTLHGGRFGRVSSFSLKADDTLAPGKYKVRYRERLGLQLDREIKRPLPSKDLPWINPTDLTIVGKYLYVLDSGLSVDDVKPGQTEREWKQKDGKTFKAKFNAYTPESKAFVLTAPDSSTIYTSVDQLSPEDATEAEKIIKEEQAWLQLRQDKSSYIYKLSRDGAAETTFGKDGRAPMGVLYNVRAFAVDPNLGTIFMATGGHEIGVFDANGAKTPQVIGGWDNDPNGPKGLVWCNSLAISKINNRIYIPLSYANGKVYDRTKNGFEGIISRFDLPKYPGLDRCVAVDGNAVYITNRNHDIERFTDEGANLKLGYASHPELKLAHPTGLSTLPGVIWVACHGPGFGPYWDSGGGGEVVLLFDDGKSISLVDRYGFPGTAAERLEFLNPSAAVPSPDHTELYVVEDGVTNPDGPSGTARIRRFKITAGVTKEIVVDVKK
jgi:hypothetical protein